MSVVVSGHCSVYISFTISIAVAPKASSTQSCAPLAVGVFFAMRDTLCCLSDNNQDHVTEAFNCTSRILNDLLDSENLYFEQINFEIVNFQFHDGDVPRSPSRICCI